MKVKLGNRTMAGAALTLLIGAIVVVAVTAAGIVGWEFSNSNAFCTNVCHAVHPEEPKAHAAAFHARVNCVECHMGRMSTLQLMAIKPTHVGELWGMVAGYERPIVTHSLRPARESCEACHWPEARHSDTVRVRYRYADDAKSTESKYTLQLHTGTGEARGAGGEVAANSAPGMAVAKGIHWHIAQDVEYVAVDPQKQKIPLVQVHGPDGKVVSTYFDSTAGVSRADAEKMPKRRMDCIDCHNASGHPFPNPADLVDDALAEERIDRSLPSIKTRSDAIIAKAAGVAGPESDRAVKFKQIIADAAPKADPKTQDKEKQFAGEMQRILLLTSFNGDHAGQPLTWKNFPSNVGHKDSPGCFRCHDGKHQNEKGEAVRLQCTLCHALPQVVREDGARSVASTVSPDLAPPSFHSEPNFMHEHRTKVDETCAACHGPTKWGQDGGNFCANPACHGRRWPEVNLDVETPKPPAAVPTKAAAAKATDKAKAGK